MKTQKIITRLESSSNCRCVVVVIGGSSVGYHTLNDKSKKYFNKAFAMSGTPITYFARMNPGNHTDLINTIAEKTGTKAQNQSQLMKFLKNVSVKDIIKYSPKANFARTTVFPWGPIIESS